MVNATEIARGIHRISFGDDPHLTEIIYPGASYNLYLIAAEQPVIIQTMFRRTFARVRAKVREILDPTSLRYIVVPHHEGDSSGAINEWLAVAPRAVPVLSERLARLFLRGFAQQ